ncbi:protein YLS9-like protein [Cinnamomum micranthum f. kanehirae]|uniref:Protein YLS9-like protein n=1 Tax=Cinnamomum micranthum f. kanehirae TaxID=337451 RepID=A0A3S3MV55_9MAGN|nr:protein YLS9-like protein [Cinnamomum micranthum f. kanehirae]
MADHQKIHPVVDRDEIASAPSDSIRSEKADQLIHQSSSNRGLGDHQRIHPLDVEASSSSAPIEPSSSFRSEKGEPAIEQIAPSDSEVVGHSDPPRRKKKWCRCICWTSIILLILIILIGTIVGILFLVYKPKIPRYSIENIKINDFKMFPNMTVYASFNVSITAVNRNKKIGIYYDGGHMAVWYTNNSLCNGSVPFFYQRPENTTVMVVVLTGSTQYGSTLMKELLELQRTGRIPLDLKVNVPVRVKFGTLKIRVKFRVRCSLVVDRLSAKNLVVSSSLSVPFSSESSTEEEGEESKNMTIEEESIEQAAAARRERLKALREAKELLSTPDEDSKETDEDKKLNMKFRNYLPHDKELQEGKLAPPVLPKFEDPVDVDPPPSEKNEMQDPFVNIAPKKPNWDLRRDVQKKLDKLERRTQKAILELLEEETQKQAAIEDGEEAMMEE